MNNEHFKKDSGCHQPGWNQGPPETDAALEDFLCELSADHEGQHEWAGFLGVSVSWLVRDEG